MKTYRYYSLYQFCQDTGLNYECFSLMSRLAPYVVALGLGTSALSGTPVNHVAYQAPPPITAQAPQDANKKSKVFVTRPKAAVKKYDVAGGPVVQNTQ